MGEKCHFHFSAGYFCRLMHILGDSMTIRLNNVSLKMIVCRDFEEQCFDTFLNAICNLFNNDFLKLHGICFFKILLSSNALAWEIFATKRANQDAPGILNSLESLN